MYASAFVLGFHGCDESVGEKVLAGKDHLKPSANDYDWLGHGIYFWENSPKRARHWAEFLASRPTKTKTPIKRPFVLGAVIDLGNCLDLTEAASLAFVRRSYDDMKMGFETIGLDLPKNEPGAKGDEDLLKRKLDCAVINYAHALREDDEDGLNPFDSVRGAFAEGEPLYAGAKIMAKTHIQVCVRKPSSIRGYFRPII
ncbi:MAG: hypothetical protein HYV75_03555 [Opitutae bacterium]|nr:hypothetical protein [Opitutae bacterium]